MAIDFPASPTVGQVFGNYKWDGEKWISAFIAPVIYVQDTAPVSPAAGSLWWESDSGTLHVYYNDGNSSQWVAIAPGAGAVAVPGHVVGEPSNGNAAAGEVGEYADTGIITTGTLVTNTATNITSMSIPAGDWDVWAGYSASGGSNPTVTDVWISLAIATASMNNTALQSFRIRGLSMTDPVLSGTLGPIRVSTAAPVTWYLNGQATYTPGTFTISGIMRRRRVR
jgi:hypothetical protein